MGKMVQVPLPDQEVLNTSSSKDQEAIDGE